MHLFPGGAEHQQRKRPPWRHVKQQRVEHESGAQHRERPLQQEEHFPGARRCGHHAGQQERGERNGDDAAQRL